MSYFTEKKEEHERLCEDAVRAGRPADARHHAAKAAEFCLALAEKTGGRLAVRYVEEAEGWLDLADRMVGLPCGGANREAPHSSPRSADARREKEGDSAADGGEWRVDRKPSVTFDDIAGMADAKRAIEEMIVLPLSRPDLSAKLGIRAGGGVLLFGPPGTGKTLLGKATANGIDAAFFYASGAQIRSKWHGESEQRLRKLIQSARSQSVAVLFLDEIEALLPKRGGNSAVDNRIVTQFLAEIGGFEDSENTLLILGATNNPWDIDDAVFRTGRFDAKIYVGLPDLAARRGILERNLTAGQREPDLDLDSWADRLDGYTGSDIVGIIAAAKRSVLGRCVKGGGNDQVSENDLLQAVESIPASVTPKLLEKYRRFREQRFR